MAGIVFFEQIYSFERDVLLRAIPNPEKVPADRFRASAEGVFDRIMQLTDNSGAADEHRAPNYLAMRYPAIYTLAAEQFAHDFSLSGVEARSSVLSGTRTIIETIFSYTNRNTDFTHKFFVRVDVTEEPHSWSGSCRHTTTAKHVADRRVAGMNTMKIPGFSAEAAMRSRGALRLARGAGLGFGCDPLGCVCSGTDDCIDLWVNTDLCSGSIISMERETFRTVIVFENRGDNRVRRPRCSALFFTAPSPV